MRAWAGLPEPGQTAILRSFAQDSIAADVKIRDIELIGSKEKVNWERQPDGLHLVAPEQLPNEMALVYKATIKQ